MSCDDDVTCNNGCCENNPCVNGGTCNEICEPTSTRYNCSCPVPFVGKHCEIQLRKSCQDYKAAGVNKTGLYKVVDNMNQTFQVFCDFDSEPGFAWNLIQSFSLENKDLTKVNSSRQWWCKKMAFLSGILKDLGQHEWRYLWLYIKLPSDRK